MKCFLNIFFISYLYLYVFFFSFISKSSYIIAVSSSYMSKTHITRTISDISDENIHYKDNKDLLTRNEKNNYSIKHEYYLSYKTKNKLSKLHSKEWNDHYNKFIEEYDSNIPLNDSYKPYSKSKLDNKINNKGSRIYVENYVSDYYSDNYNTKYTQKQNNNHNILNQGNKSNIILSNQNNLNNSSYSKQQTSFKEFLTNLLILYVDSFLILSLLAFLKIFEEINLIKTRSLENKYESYFDVNTKPLDIEALDYLNVYVQGKAEISNSIKDNIFHDFFLKEDSLALKRKIELIDVQNKRIIEYTESDLSLNTIRTDLINKTVMYTIKNHNYQSTEDTLINKNVEVVIFPMLVKPAIFTATAYLNNIRLSEHQLKQLTCSHSLDLIGSTELNNKSAEFCKQHNIENCLGFENGNSIIIPSKNYKDKYIARISLESVREIIY